MAKGLVNKLKSSGFVPYGDNEDINTLMDGTKAFFTIFDDVFEKYTNFHYLQKTKTTNMGSLFQLTYRVVLKADINEKRFIDKIRSKNGNLKVVLSQPMEEEEL